MTNKQRITDSVLDQVSSLPMHDVDDLRRERIRLRAQSVLAARSEAARQSVAVRKGFGARYLEPALVSGFAFFVLVWAVERTVFLLSPW